jgi:hypothetical protein
MAEEVEESVMADVAELDMKERVGKMTDRGRVEFHYHPPPSCGRLARAGS